MKKYLLLLLGLSFTLAIIIIVSFIPKKTTLPVQSAITPTPIPVIAPSKTQSPSITTIQPGTTTQRQVIATFGQPASTESNNDLTVLHYPVPDTTRQNNVYVKSNVVQYINESITNDNTLLQDHTSSTKETEDGILYDPQQIETGFTWHVFAKSGIAYLASTNGYTIQVLHFPPTTYQDFLQTTAKTFSLSTTPNDTIERF